MSLLAKLMSPDGMAHLLQEMRYQAFAPPPPPGVWYRYELVGVGRGVFGGVGCVGVGRVVFPFEQHSKKSRHVVCDLAGIFSHELPLGARLPEGNRFIEEFVTPSNTAHSRRWFLFFLAAGHKRQATESSSQNRLLA
jgi:hypothetical protein